MTLNEQFTRQQLGWYNSATSDQQKVFRDWLANLLFSEEVTVVFTKKDGTLREMLCTLKPEKMPKVDKRDERQRSSEALSVWDIEKESWRSFRFDSVTEVKFSVGE